MMVTMQSVTHILNQNNRVVRHKNHSTVARTGEMSVYYAPLLKSRRNTGLGVSHHGALEIRQG
jgi:hypothetical protein